jgi:D-cysteine desulfhydrase
LLGIPAAGLGRRLTCVGGYWQPKYSIPNQRMIEAIEMLAQTEAILLDPVYTGKVMAGLIGLARQGRWTASQRVLFLHTGGMPSLFHDPQALRQPQLLQP